MMMIKKISSFGAKALFIATVSFLFSFSGFSKDSYILATASTGGTFYPVGVAIATLVKVKLEPKEKISMSAINSAGSGENVKLIRENEAQFAILQGLYGHFAKTGTGPLAKEGKQKHLLAVTMLWPNVEHFVVEKRYAKTGTVQDMKNLKGKTVALGKKNSGTIGSNKMLLGNLGIDINKDYQLFYKGYGGSADALADGKVAGFGIPAGDPAAAVSKAFASIGSKIRFLEFTPELAKKADNGMGLWVPYVIPAGTYAGIDKPLNTIAQPNFLAVRDSVSEEDVYKITKTIYENLAFLRGIHKATGKMSLENALPGIPVKLHPGALKYYKEAGVKIPKSLQ